MQNKPRKHSGGLEAFRWSLFTTLILLAFNAANGQSVLITPPPVPAEIRTSESTTDTNQVSSAGGGTVSASSGGAQPNSNPFQWGPVMLHPRLAYGFSYGTGLHSLPGQTSRSAINTLSPGITLDLGDHWELSYTAGASFYSDPNFKDSVDHNISLHGHTTYEDWAFSLSQNVAITSDPLVETAQQTDQQAYSTALGTSYQINSDWSAQLTASQDLRYSEGLKNSAGSTSDWSLSGGLNYQIAPSLSTGVGAGFGYSQVGVGPDMTYENLNGQISWHVAQKISLSVSGGAQIRQFLGSGQSSLLSPTFGVGLSYQPLDFTGISLSASRGVTPSLFQNEVTESTSVNAGISQRLLKVYYLSLSAGYSVTTYQDSTLTGAVFHGREDTRSFFTISLSRSFLKRGTASVSYSKSHNSSANTTGFSYDSDQIGFSIAYSY